MNQKETLEGGREGKIVKQGDQVVRPANVWSSSVHCFLEFLISLFLKDETIENVAKLLYSFHQAGRKYISHLSGQEQWMLPPVTPIEVMCHGDFVPYNVTIMDEKPQGIIDFDMLHSGPALWDIAYAVYRWVPFTSPDNPDHYNNLEEQIRRMKLYKSDILYILKNAQKIRDGIR